VLDLLGIALLASGIGLTAGGFPSKEFRQDPRTLDEIREGYQREYGKYRGNQMAQLMFLSYYTSRRPLLYFVGTPLLLSAGAIFLYLGW